MMAAMKEPQPHPAFLPRNADRCLRAGHELELQNKARLRPADRASGVEVVRVLHEDGARRAFHAALAAERTVPEHAV